MKKNEDMSIIKIRFKELIECRLLCSLIINSRSERLNKATSIISYNEHVFYMWIALDKGV